MTQKLCEYVDCDRPTIARGYCSGHYSQQARGQELRPLNLRPPARECSRPYCTIVTKSKGLCAAHESRQYTWRRAGIVDGTWERFDDLWNEQDGMCGACGKDLDITSRRTHLDHDHRTGRSRGVLCHNCNQGIGSFLENISAMLGAVEYLTKHPGDPQ